MKNKITLVAGVMAVAFASTGMANVMLNSSGVDIVLSTGTGIQQDYNITVTPTFTADSGNPADIKVVGNVESNQAVAAGSTVSIPRALVFYTKQRNPLTGTLGISFTATVGDKAFTNSYQLPVDAQGNLTAFDDLPDAQNGIVCELSTVPAAGGGNPKINIECQSF